MPSKTKIICLNCNKEKLVFVNKKRPSKFCCWQCSADYKRNVFLESWLSNKINGTYEKIGSSLLHERCIEYFKKNIHNCEICGSGKTWNNKPLTFEVDHIDGNRKNNFRENLRYICPNCHSQTPTFRAKNIKNPPIAQR